MRYGEAAVRRDELRRRVEQHGYLASRQVAQELAVSDMTIRRDLDQLAEEGVVLRVVGGARRPTGAPFAQRAAAATSAKEQVGEVCAALLAAGSAGPGAVVALDAGTTVEQVARRLPGGLTVVTHSVPVMTACADRDDLTLVGLGGHYHPPTRSFGGPETRAQLAGLEIDLAVVSASALRPRGLFCHDATEAETKRTLLSLAARRLVVADAGKLAARAPVRVAGWDAVDLLVTDDGLGTDGRATLTGWAPTLPVRTPTDLAAAGRSPS
ncbi:DeoR/GlpR family DNA-binding transcription regulator [Microlunatus lacustris]